MIKSLLAFSLTLFTGIQLFGQNKLLVSEVYNYDVGDLYHIEESNAGPTGGGVIYYRTEIMDKYYSTGLDTLYYVRDVRQVENNSSFPFDVFTNYIDTLFYTNLNDTINAGNLDSLYSDPYYNNRQVNLVWILNSSYENSYDYYIEGCGGEYTEYSNIYGSTYSKKLVYYKKGTETWGTPITNSVLENAENTEIKLYPNPISNQLSIQLSELGEVNSLQIHNAVGQLIESVPLLDLQTDIDFSDYPDNLYFIQFQYNGKTITTKKVVKQ